MGRTCGMCTSLFQTSTVKSKSSSKNHYFLLPAWVHRLSLLVTVREWQASQYSYRVRTAIMTVTIASLMQTCTALSHCSLLHCNASISFQPCVTATFQANKMPVSLLPWMLSSEGDCSREVGGKASCSPRACNSQQLLHQREHGQGPPWLLCVPVSAQTGCQLIYMQRLINVMAQFIYPMWKAEKWLLDLKIRHKCWAVEGREISAVLPGKADATVTVSVTVSHRCKSSSSVLTTCENPAFVLHGSMVLGRKKNPWSVSFNTSYILQNLCSLIYLTYGVLEACTLP